MQILFNLTFSHHLAEFNSYFTINNFVFSIIIEFLVADKPARASVLNMQSSNSQYFCPCCLAQTKTRTINGKRHIFVPLNQELFPRTNEGYAACAYSADSTRLPEYGIKGTCFLQNISNINIITFNLFDYMHAVCLGIFKSLLNLLFLNSSTIVSFRSSVKTIDRDILNIVFSSAIVKSQPLLCNHSTWKAKDFRNFFFFCFPFLNIGPHIIIDSILQLRKGIIVLFENVTHEKCEIARTSFSNFINGFAQVFGEEFLTPNFHDLHHLPDMALKCGSIADFSGLTLST